LVQNIVNGKVPIPLKVYVERPFQNCELYLLTKEKVVVAFDPIIAGKPLSETSTQEAKTHEEKEVQLYHLGKKGKDGVKWGYSRKKNIIRIVGTDSGGHTNINFRPGPNEQKVPQLEDAEPVGKPLPYNSDADDLLEEWNQETKKALGTEEDMSGTEQFHEWVNDVREKFHDGTFRLYKMKPHNRFLMSARTVRTMMDRYYQREYNVEHKYYTEPKLQKLQDQYCSISFSEAETPFVTPNINTNNLQNEYKWAGTRGEDAGDVMRRELLMAELKNKVKRVQGGGHAVAELQALKRRILQAESARGEVDVELRRRFNAKLSAMM